MFSASSHDAHGAPPTTQATALLIEDNPIHQLVTELTLKKERLAVVPTDNIEDGWEKLQRGDFNLVITDLSLGGFALIERMRATPRFAHIPVIITSAARDHDTIQQMLGAGAQAYLPKPYELSRLVAEVRRALGDKQ